MFCHFLYSHMQILFHWNPPWTSLSPLPPLSSISLSISGVKYLFSWRLKDIVEFENRSVVHYGLVVVGLKRHENNIFIWLYPQITLYAAALIGWHCSTAVFVCQLEGIDPDCSVGKKGRAVLVIFLHLVLLFQFQIYGKRLVIVDEPQLEIKPQGSLQLLVLAKSSRMLVICLLCVVLHSVII